MTYKVKKIGDFMVENIEAKKKQNKLKRIKTITLINMILSILLCLVSLCTDIVAIKENGIISFVNIISSPTLCLTNNFYLLILTIIQIVTFIIVMYCLIKIIKQKNIGIILLIIAFFIAALFFQYSGYKKKRIEHRVNGEIGVLLPQRIYIYSKISEVKDVELKSYLQEEFETSDTYIKQINVLKGFDDGQTYVNILYKNTNGEMIGKKRK